eukprot:CAMPEP_0174375798 /NCGR_PEP_ID=MMETSP0811_2-20130205/115871_1 /TAXON_ID=73025 ORGANISM="Eutreptiella gymnastica-like, Strain CCMP1594" /NCGR_SAMPLE_ID=MMETSP0811_2 /ASSEMBLY_ACC=CAM_ASM_000667 /LENGTH=48 /DNA_ID= /DNA_START= /DNA_END= /DNA_ORIENTATION=
MPVRVMELVAGTTAESGWDGTQDEEKRRAWEKDTCGNKDRVDRWFVLL